MELRELLSRSDGQRRMRDAATIIAGYGADPARTRAIPQDEPRRAARRLPPTETEALVVGYGAGGTVYELGKSFGIHRVTAAKLLRRAGLRLRGDGLNAGDVAAAARLYKQGLSLAKVGEHFAVSASTVHRALKERGIPMRDTQGRER